MGTKVNSNYEDLLTFTRASKGHALRPVSYGDELVTNGTFDSDTTGWTLDGTGTIASVSGEIVVTATGGNTSAYQDVSVTTGSIYQLSVGKNSGGYVYVYDDAAFSPSIAGFPIFNVGGIFYIVPTKTNIRIRLFEISGGTATFDNVSVKEVLFDQPDGTLTLFEHPNNIPRVEYDADGVRLGLLVEEARTNLVYGSTSPPTDGSTKTLSDRILSPAQQLNADLFKENTSTSAHGLRRTGILPTQGATDYTISVYAKAKERRYLQLRLYANSTSNDVFGFDLQEGTAPAGGSIENVGNGWYRCSATLNVNNSTGGFNFAAAQMGSDSVTYYYAGDGSSGMYIFGLQVEAGSFSTSYIKNDGLSGGVTRSADVASIPVADFGYNQSAGTFFIDFSHRDIDGGTETNYALSTSPTARFLYNNGGTTSWNNFDGTGSLNFGSLPFDGSFAKVAVGMDKDGSNGVVDGGSIATSAATPQENVTTADTLTIGSKFSSGAEINGHIKSIKYYPRRLTNAQLQALTEPRSDATLSLTFDGLESSFTENYIHG